MPDEKPSEMKTEMLKEHSIPTAVLGLDIFPDDKRALVACARKMLIFANTVVARGTPWCEEPPARNASPTGTLSVS